MASNVRQESPGIRQSRKTLRIRFYAVKGAFQLVSYERLEMTCPPSIGETPKAGKHGGFWMEVRDASDRVLFHRLLHSPLGDSVDVHSPDGKIRRAFGTPSTQRVFEVLLPDAAQAKTIVLMGGYLDPSEAKQRREPGSRELARFDVPKGEGGSGECK